MARRTALFTLVLGVLVFGAGLALLRDDIAPRPGSDLSLRMIWAVSVATTLLGFGFALRDTLRLWREWRAIQAVEKAGSQALQQLGQARTLKETLAVRRLRSVLARQGDGVQGAAELRTTLRADAAMWVAPIGAVPRFVGSMLLLLAVLGTFAGMRSALPELIEQLKHVATATGAVGGLSGMGAALEPVVNAFGANFLALLGSLVMGIVAFGAISERRSLLGALEEASERKIYPLLPAGADATELQRAVGELRRAVDQVAGVSQSVDDLRTGIRAFNDSLVGAIGSMQRSFNDSIRQQALSIQQELTRGVGSATSAISEASKILAQTAVAYEGLVRGLEERDLGLQGTAAALRDTADRVCAGLERASGALVQSTQGTREAQEELAAQAARSADAERELAGAAGRLVGTGERIAGLVAAQSEHVSALPARFEQLTASQEAVAGRVEALGGELRDGLARLDQAGTETARAGLRAVEGVLERLLAAVADGQARAERAAEESRARGREAVDRRLVEVLDEVRATGEASARAIARLRAEIERAAAGQPAVPKPGAPPTPERNARLEESVERVAATLQAVQGALEQSLRNGGPQPEPEHARRVDDEIDGLRRALAELGTEVRARVAATRSALRRGPGGPGPE